MKTPRDPLMDLKPEERASVLRFQLQDLVSRAEAAGVVLEIRLVPLRPLAMGNVGMVPSARVKRTPAEPKAVHGGLDDSRCRFCGVTKALCECA